MHLEDYFENVEGRARLRCDITDFLHDDIITDNPEMIRQLRLIERVASSSAPILIEGEQGVGKEQFARYAFNRSERHARNYVQLNCAAIPKEKWAVELFGQVPSVSSGFRNGSILDVSSGGTLFIKDVNMMPRDIQVRLVDLLNEQIPDKAGGRPHYDIRIIAAYRSSSSQRETFSHLTEELYYHLNVIKVRIPPLRERPEDILLTATYYLQQITSEYNLRHSFGWNVLSMLLDIDWADNTRQLRNTVERLVWLSESEVIRDPELLMECVSSPVRNRQELPRAVKPDIGVSRNRSLKELVSDYEIFIINQYIERYGSLRKAAAALSVSPASLSRKLNRKE